MVYVGDVNREVSYTSGGGPMSSPEFRVTLQGEELPTYETIKVEYELDSDDEDSSDIIELFVPSQAAQLPTEVYTTASKTVRIGFTASRGEQHSDKIEEHTVTLNFYGVYEDDSEDYLGACQVDLKG